MAGYSKTSDLQKLERVGRILAHRLHEARQRQGVLLCPVCRQMFEGTHLLKCPFCRTLISTSFREIHHPPASEKMELDFFPISGNGGDDYCEPVENAPLPTELMCTDVSKE